MQCPRCDGMVYRDLHDDLVCVVCGWRNLARLPAAPPDMERARREAEAAHRSWVNRFARRKDMAPASVNANNRGRDHANEPSRVAGAGAARKGK